MGNYFVVASSGPLYDLFYNLAFLFVLSILIIEGIKRRFPLLKWIFLLLLTRFLFITGTKIFTFSSAEWELLFTNYQLPETNDKSLIGGLLFGGIGLVSGFYLLRFKKNITDAFAFAIPVGIAVQRLGCFFTGCCFGKVSTLPWAVQYPVQSLAHYHQFNDGIINTSNLLSYPVHPVQLYEILGLILLVVMLYRFRKRLHRPGSLFVLSIVFVLVVRIGIEFFRDIHAHTIGGKMLGPFNATQLFLFCIVLFLLYYLYRREKVATAVQTNLQLKDLSLPVALSLLIFFALLLQGFKNWFSFSEMAPIILVLILASGVLIYRIFDRIYLSPYRWLYLAGSILPLFLMAQSYPLVQDSASIKTYKTIKFGMGAGNFMNERDIGHGSGCDRVSKDEYFKQRYTLASGGFEFAHENVTQKYRVRYGTDLTFGKHNEKRVSDDYEIENKLFFVSPYALYETNWLDIGAGIHAGNVVFIYESKLEEGKEIPLSGSKSLAVYPRLYFRLGPERWFFADYSLAHNFPSALPGFRQQLGVGTGFGLRNGTRFRIGSDLGDFGYLSGYVPIQDKVVIQPMFLWANPGYPDSDKHRQFSIGLSYRFGHDEKKKPNP